MRWVQAKLNQPQSTQRPLRRKRRSELLGESGANLSSARSLGDFGYEDIEGIGVQGGVCSLALADDAAASGAHVRRLRLDSLRRALRCCFLSFLGDRLEVGGCFAVISSCQGKSGSGGSLKAAAASSGERRRSSSRCFLCSLNLASIFWASRLSGRPEARSEDWDAAGVVIAN